MTFRILTLNNISVRGLDRLPRDRYEVASEIGHPDAVMVRSADMHSMEVPPSVKAVARAGAGTNNIPVAKLSARGIPVFNAPGANANAVKELVIASLFLAARNVCQAWEYVRGLKGSDHEVEEAVEKGKKKFVGFELPGRTLGVGNDSAVIAASDFFGNTKIDMSGGNDVLDFDLANNDLGIDANQFFAAATLLGGKGFDNFDESLQTGYAIPPTIKAFEDIFSDV